MVGETGPWVQAALICEKVLKEDDGTLSAIRIVDKLTLHAQGPDVPETMPKFPLQFVLLIMLKSGSAKGREKLVLRPRDPSGLAKPDYEFWVEFEGEERGVNRMVNFTIEAPEEGLYWLELFIGDEQRVLTKVPLRVSYEPSKVQGGR
ncbi:MAG: hypothetical protein M1319_00630 [Chloroflexi bacterium]|nr:hypothetical protein [Chloroflexota bacterium]